MEMVAIVPRRRMWVHANRQLAICRRQPRGLGQNRSKYPLCSILPKGILHGLADISQWKLVDDKNVLGERRAFANSPY